MALLTWDSFACARTVVTTTAAYATYIGRQRFPPNITELSAKLLALLFLMRSGRRI